MYHKIKKMATILSLKDTYSPKVRFFDKFVYMILFVVKLILSSNYKIKPFLL